MSSEGNSSIGSLSTGLPARTGNAVGQPEAIRILFVEDDEAFRATLSGELHEHGFSVRGFADGKSLLEDEMQDADLLLLDWGLPGTTGIDLLKQVRQRGIHLPTVFLTGRALVANERLALDGGAVDFINKSRGIDILISRLKLVCRSRVDVKARQEFICGKLTLRPAISRAYWDGTDMNFTVGEYNVVHFLASNVGSHVTYRAIYDRMHYAGFLAGAGEAGYRANVRSAIKRIRNKFRELDPGFAEIQNYTGFGYCWGKPRDLG
jgi:two-component system, OmpR family, response regulator ChvI